MKNYRSRELVRAFKVVNIASEFEGDGWLISGFYAEDHLRVEPQFMHRYEPRVGGYIVFRHNHHPAWLSAGAFERDYVEVP
jgi:hypothetical protein